MPDTPNYDYLKPVLGEELFGQFAEKMAAAEEVVRKAMETDPNIYLIYPVADTDGYSCTDKTHPSDMGYHNWAESIRQPILDILSRYPAK